MAFIRTSTFALSREDAEEIRPGKAVYNALVPARKFLIQTMDGLIQTGVWRSTNSSGKIMFTIFTEWSTLADMQIYVSNPIVREMEQQLAAAGDPMQVAVYEAIG